MRNSKIIALSVIVVSLTFNLAQSAPTTRAPQTNAVTGENLANRATNRQEPFNEADFLVNDADLQQIVAHQTTQSEGVDTMTTTTESTYSRLDRQLQANLERANQIAREAIETITASTLTSSTSQDSLISQGQTANDGARNSNQDQPNQAMALDPSDFLGDEADMELIIAALEDPDENAITNLLTILNAQREEERRRRIEAELANTRRLREHALEQTRLHREYRLIGDDLEFQQVLNDLEREAAESILQNPDNYIGKEVEFDDVIRLLEYVDQAKEIPSPEEQFDDEAKDPTDACPICLGSLSKKPDKLNIDLPCEHRFHIRCIKFWVTEALGRDSDTGRATCPVCRSKINYEQLKFKRLSDDQPSSSGESHD